MKWDREAFLVELTSRKFWMALAGFATTVLTALNVDGLAVTQVTAILGAVGLLAAYIVGEGICDSKKVKGGGGDGPGRDDG